MFLQFVYLQFVYDYDVESQIECEAQCTADSSCKIYSYARKVYSFESDECFTYNYAMGVSSVQLSSILMSGRFTQGVKN